MTITSTLELRDSFSNTIDQIVNAVNYSITAMEQMRDTMEAPINNDAFKSARAAVDRMNDSIRAMETAAQGGANGTDNFSDAVSDVEAAAKQADNASRQMGEGIKTAGDEGKNAAGNFMSTADSISQMLIAAGGYKILGFVKDSLTEAASAAIEFESAVTGIYKTVEGTPEQLQELSDAVRNMATQMPATTTEIAGVMEAAGQLGIATNNVDEFAKTMIDLGECTNLTSDAAASMLAKFANVTQMDPSYYENLGSVIVDLGNNFATTEADIVNMSSYLASAATLAGFAQTDILGLSAAMSSVGIEAEAGGSAMSKLITKMQIAVETGNGLTDFASTAKMTVQEFSDTFQNNAVGALQAFITGLNDVERNGASASVILQQMDLDDIRLSNTIRALASSNGLMSDAVNTASAAWENNSALTNEVSKRYETLESKLQMTKNSANDLKIAVGDALTPVLSKLTDAGKDVLDWLSDFAKNNQAVTAGITGFTASIGTIAGGLTTVIPIASQATQAFMSLKNSMTMKMAAQQGISVADAASQVGAKLTGLIGKFGLVAGGISLAVGVISSLVTAFSDAKTEVEDYNGTLEECSNEIENVKAAHENAVQMYGEESDAARQLGSQLDTLNAQYEKGGGAAEDYAQRAEKSAETFKQTSENFEKQMDKINADKTLAFTMTQQLEALSGKTVKTNDDLNLMNSYAEYLNDTFECNIKVNYDTGSLTGFDPKKLSDDYLNEAVESQKQAARNALKDDIFISAYQSDVKNLSGLTAQIREKSKELEAVYEEVELTRYYRNPLKNVDISPKYDFEKYDYSKIYEAFQSGGYSSLFGQSEERYEKFEKELEDYNSLLSEYHEMQGEISGAEKDIQEYFNTLGTPELAPGFINGIKGNVLNESGGLSGVVEKLKSGFDTETVTGDLEALLEGFGGIAEGAEKATSAMGEFNSQTIDDAITQGLQEISQELVNAAKKYDEVYQAAYESFSKQYSLFDDAKESYKKTVDEIIKDGDSIIQNYIDSKNAQADYFSSINESIQTLSETSAANIGVSRQEWNEFLEYASQLPQTAGEKGAAVVNAFAEALSNGDYATVKEAVRAWQDNDKAMSDTSKSIALEVSDIEQAMQKGELAVAKSLQNIGQQAGTAYQKAKSVVDSLAQGVNSGYGYLATQVSAIESLMSRLASFNVSVNVDKKGSGTGAANGYATGTLSAAPGLALVGENGPELVNFGGGEVVYTADQTRRILGDRQQNLLPQIQLMNMKQPEVIVNIPAINLDLGREFKKYNDTEYYTEALPPEDDSPHISDDEMKYLRELTEREVLNKIYQPQITNKIEISNSISKDADLDELVHNLSVKLIDVMSSAAEGVHF